MGLARDMENLPSSGSAKLPSSSQDRLPTVSASDALQSLQAKGPRAVSTGLATLDAALSGHTIGASKKNGGLEFGKVTELWGPPGSGKTAFAAQTAATALQEDNAVVWIGRPLIATWTRIDRH
ncbi:hypothetical protein M8818_003657 [Zalaria obscura]|uniref:Uncharacterized protein n=1 Tax=Zalaria obscura TaxID=2024903 RepID=A0ACC3SEE0_9PEZI